METELMNTRCIDSRISRRRRIITIASAVLAAIVTGVTFAMMRQRVPNMHIIFYLVLGMMALLLICLVIWTLSASEKYSRLAKTLRRGFIICLAIGILCFSILQGLIISGSHSDDADVDCIIILGAGLRNGYPSLVLSTRLNAALDYLKGRGDIPVIVSGGLGRGESVTEAEAMYRYLKARGVDERLIWKEDASTNTQENLAFSRAIMEEMGLDVGNIKVAVVTNEFHLYRAKLIAEKAGLNAFGIAADTPCAQLHILYSFREAFSLSNEILFGRRAA